MIRSPGRLVLLGHPVGHSLSPTFQNAALRRAALPLEYVALDVAPADLDRTLVALRAERAAGNVTIPHKFAMIRACAEVTPLAARTGAVNTFWTREDGALAGDNTDVAGVEAAVRALVGHAPARTGIVLLGAGGAAAAVLAAAASWPAGMIQVWSRRPDAARALAARFPGTVAPVEALAGALAGALARATLVINATPVGMTDDALPCPLEAIAPHAAVLDLVYRRGETAFVRAARARGHRAADGLVMLLEQGALAFERWFGVAPDREAMRASIS